MLFGTPYLLSFQFFVIVFLYLFKFKTTKLKSLAKVFRYFVGVGRWDLLNSLFVYKINVSNTILLYMQISSKIDTSDPTANKTQTITDEITRLCRKDTQETEDEQSLVSRYSLPLAGLVVASAAVVTYYVYQRNTTA